MGEYNGHILTPNWKSKYLYHPKQDGRFVLSDHCGDALMAKLINEGWIDDSGYEVMSVLKKEEIKGPDFSYDRVEPPIDNKNHKTQDAPEQPLPVTIDNFFIRTYGVWQRKDKIPDGFWQFFVSKSSKYYRNDAGTHIVRVSDHWGHSIRFCNWFLRMEPSSGYRRISSFTWSKRYKKEIFIGYIHINDLTPNKVINGNFGDNPNKI